MSMQHKLALHLLPGLGREGRRRVGHLSPGADGDAHAGPPELLRIPKPGGGNYYVEYRAPIGFFDSQAPLLQGVLIRTECAGCSGRNRTPTRR